MYPVEHTSARILLREIGIDDVDAVHAIYGNADATEHLSFEPRSRDQVGQIIARSMVSATTRPRDEYCLAVADHDSGRLIGYARLALDPHQPKAATMGFALNPMAWGVGYGTETVRAMLALAFDNLDLHRVWAARAPSNSASHKTLLRAAITYSILDAEWKAATDE